jgi:restriction endonuclease S subunit
MSFKAVLLGEIAVQDRVIVEAESVEAASLSYLGLEQIAAGTGHVLSYETSSEEGKSTTFAFNDSHVLYGKLRPYLNKVAVPDRSGRCSTEIIPLKPVGVEKDYLALLLRSDRVVSAAMSDKTGSRMPRADMDALLGLEVLIATSQDQQRQIATRLKSQLAEVETARQAAQTQLQDSRLLRSRLLKQFFAALDVGPKKKLGDFAPTTSGSTPSRGETRYWQPADIAWVKTGEVAFAPITATEEAISNKALAECSLSLLPPKTVLIAMYGQGKTRGQSAILEIPATTNQACFAVLPNVTWKPDFLFLWLQASYQDLRDLSDDRGGNQANLNGALLNALEVPAPNQAEQQALVLRIQAAMAEVDAIEASAKVALADIQRLPSRVLAQAFNPQGDHHGQ